MRWMLLIGLAALLWIASPQETAAQSSSLAWQICENDPSDPAAPGDCETTVEGCPACGELCSPFPPPCSDVPVDILIIFLLTAQLNPGFEGIPEIAFGLPPGLGRIVPEHTAILEEGIVRPLLNAGDEEAVYATLMPAGGHRWSRFIDEGFLSGGDIPIPVQIRIAIDPSEQGLPNSAAWRSRALRQMLVGFGGSGEPQQLVPGLAEGEAGCRKLKGDRHCSLLHGRELASCKMAVREACAKGD